LGLKIFLKIRNLTFKKIIFFLKMSESSNVGLYLGTAGLAVGLGGAIYNNHQIQKLNERLNEQGKYLQGFITQLTKLQQLEKGSEGAIGLVKELKSSFERICNSNEELKIIVTNLSEQQSQLANHQTYVSHYLKEMMQSIEHVNKHIESTGGEIYKPKKINTAQLQGQSRQFNKPNVQSQRQPQRQAAHFQPPQQQAAQFQPHQFQPPQQQMYDQQIYNQHQHQQQMFSQQTQPPQQHVNFVDDDDDPISQLEAMRNST